MLSERLIMKTGINCNWGQIKCSRNRERERNEKRMNVKCVRLCVCVCVRERERVEESRGLIHCEYFSHVNYAIILYEFSHSSIFR